MQNTHWTLATAVLLVALQLFTCLSAQKDTENGGNGLYGGDIMLTPEQQAALEATANPNDPFSPQRAVVRNPRSLWPKAEVPYVIDSSLGTSASTAIENAINDYRQRTCVKFVQRNAEADYVRFYRGNGCFSFIGRVRGAQDISIGPGCERKGIVIHEMFHALGRWHEQSRPDRDMYVRINRQNIQSGFENNFDITSTAFTTTQGIPYDLGSVMHYGARAFSRNRQPTIEPIDPNVPLNSLGQRNGLSNSDIQHVNALYCGATTGSWSSWGTWSVCSRTCNGGTRSRTRTCQGGTGCLGSNIDTERCNEQACPVVASWGSWTSWSACSTSCGGGRQQRSRVCNGGNTCVGANNQFRDCNTQSCPQPQTWGAWSSWSACSSTCQGGVRERIRRCQNGNNCPGNGLQTEFCNSNVPCTSQPNPNTGEWSQWTRCTRSCGGGVRFRTRMCGTDNCTSQTDDCNTQECNPEPNLQGYKHIGCYFVPRFRSNLGLLEGNTTDLSDDPRTRTNPIGKCGAAAQPYFSIFAISVGYCISGSSRLSDYQYIRNSFCRNGVGNYITFRNGEGHFVMDVYEIQNQQAFRDSLLVSQVETTTESSSNAEGTVDLSVDSSAPVISTNLTVLLTLAFVTLVCIALQLS